MKGKQLTLDQCKLIIDKVKVKNDFKRINLAGGEPMMATFLQDLIDYIVKNDFECSLITNGSLLTEEFVKLNKGKLSMIGISVDSINDDINNLIGRKTLNNLYQICETIKENNIILKINICVSKNNLNCDFYEFVDKIRPDRLKLLQLMPSPHSKESYDLVVQKQEFDSVCETLRIFNPICEDNLHMKEAYWIVDSEGFYGKNNLHLSDIAKVSLLN